MRRDPGVFLMGEEVGYYQGAYKVTRGLLEEFGPERVVDTPIAEAGFAGVGVGAAMTGLRPIIEFMTWNFSLVAFDQIVNSAAKMLPDERGAVPRSHRVPRAQRFGAAGRRQHSHSVEPFYANFPGLHVVYPSTAATPRACSRPRFETMTRWSFSKARPSTTMKGEVPDESADETIPFGKARIAREGKHVTVVVWGRPYWTVMEVAEQFAKEGIELEVIDPRTLRPLDHASIVASVKKTNRCVVVHEHWSYGGPGAEIVDRVQREAFDYLDAPVLRATNLDVPMPYAAHLEQKVIVDAPRIREAIQKVLYAR
jgi:pyruvate dehydrogenase E1 component beta subunit